MVDFGSHWSLSSWINIEIFPPLLPTGLVLLIAVASVEAILILLLVLKLTKILLREMAFRDGSLGSCILMVDLRTPSRRYKLIFSTVLLLLHLTISFAVRRIIYRPQVDLNSAPSRRIFRFRDIFRHRNLGWSTHIKIFIETSRFLAFFEAEEAFGVRRFRGTSLALIDVSVEAVLWVVEILQLT